MTDTQRNGTTNRRNGASDRMKAIVDPTEPTSLPPHPDTMMRWLTLGMLGSAALISAVLAFIVGGWQGTTLGLLAGGQAVAAVLLSRE